MSSLSEIEHGLRRAKLREPLGLRAALYRRKAGLALARPSYPMSASVGHTDSHHLGFTRCDLNSHQRNPHRQRRRRSCFRKFNLRVRVCSRRAKLVQYNARKSKPRAGPLGVPLDFRRGKPPRWINKYGNLARRRQPIFIVREGTFPYIIGTRLQ